MVRNGSSSRWIKVNIDGSAGDEDGRMVVGGVFYNSRGFLSLVCRYMRIRRRVRSRNLSHHHVYRVCICSCEGLDSALGRIRLDSCGSFGQDTLRLCSVEPLDKMAQLSSTHAADELRHYSHLQGRKPGSECSHKVSSGQNRDLDYLPRLSLALHLQGHLRKTLLPVHMIQAFRNLTVAFLNGKHERSQKDTTL